MLFKYTFTSNDGSRKTSETEATARSEAMAKLRLLGIVPIKLEEHRKKATSRRIISTASARKIIVISILSIVAVVALVCINLANTKDITSTSAGTRKLTDPLESPSRQIKAETAPRHIGALSQIEAMPRPKPDDWDLMSKRERSDWMRENRPIDMDTVISTAPVVSSFRKNKSGRKPNFGNYVQSELAHYVMPGRILPPPDYITDEQAREAFDVPIEYLIDDSEATLEEKQTVSEMLQELREFMDAGGHANEYFQQLYARQEAEGEAIQTARHEVRLLLEEGRLDDARETLEAFNAYLAEKGIPPINVKVPSRFIQ